MLQLKNIVKNYYVADQTVQALRGVSINFRESEFVSVLGASGCGKTTLLNIVGGLDRYTDGDLIINGVSTKNYHDSDWDSYRNHSIGFVFQSYNLISHQSVLKNVELALTLSGIKGDEKRQRAVDALTKVGLHDQINKLPNQLSGGQMQRVAIARAIVNNPDIILADEPTGALDTTTSVQIMDILKEISKNKLVIMVTHNPDLAEKYSTRIIKLNDGQVVGDSLPFTDEDAIAFGEQATITEKNNSQTSSQDSTNASTKKKKAKKKRKTSMSFFTALSLSLNNLKTKFARTFLTAFAGSFGIIGIALILALSNGFNGYVQDIQRDTLTNYPITISQANFDYSSALLAMMGGANGDTEKYPDEKEIKSQNTINDMLSTIVDGIKTNDTKTFKAYLETNVDRDMISAIQYDYNLNQTVYTEIDSDATPVRAVSPVKLPELSSVPMEDVIKEAFKPYYSQFETLMNRQSVFAEMINNTELINEQYDVLEGQLPQNENQAVIVVDEYNQLSDMTLYMMGLMGDNDIMYIFTRLGIKMQDEYAAQNAEANGTTYTKKTDEELDNATEEKLGYGRSKMTYSFDDLMKLKYYVLLPGEKYTKDGEPKTDVYNQTVQKYKEMTEEEVTSYITSGKTSQISISGIVRLKEGASSGALLGSVCYGSGFTAKLIEKNDSLDIVKEHKLEEERAEKRQEGMLAAIAAGTIPQESRLAIPYIKYTNILTGSPYDTPSSTSTTYADVTALLGISYEDTPTSISIYPSSFENKTYITDFIDDYNKTHIEKEQIKYTDLMGGLMNSITTIINAVSYVLIAFVSISLVVSSIMIGVITYISVLERTKEIGILRSIGASKRDIRRVFNAETGIIGFTAGILGVGIALLLTIPVNIIIESLAGLSGVAALPIWGGLGLVAISMVLTLISGLFPASTASKKDPVIALRTD